jgi:pimeloyl-ACP methyl ester carboxylesterase
MIRQLSQMGYPRDYLYAVVIQPNVMGNIEAAETVIQPAVEHLLEKVKSSARDARYSGVLPHRVSMVSHSMGSVSARWYAAKLNPERVQVWISIGGANHGSDVLCEFRDAGAADLCPAYASNEERNPLQVALNGVPGIPVDETPWGIGPDPDGVPRVAPEDRRRIAYFTIRIEPDPWILPAASATLLGAGVVQSDAVEIPGFRETSQGNFQAMTGTTHDDMPWDVHIINLVGKLLLQYPTDEISASKK